MEFIRGINNLRDKHYGCALTIGKFDGVHLGHQQVLAKLLAKARALDLPATAMIFEPHPEEFFAPDKAPGRLSHWRDKYQWLKQIGLQRLLCAKFDQKFAAQSPESFIKDFLVDGLGIRYLVVGDDFRFGKNRAGNFDMLQQAGDQYGFEVVNTNSFKLKGDRISSSLIRQQVEQGQFELARQGLGRPYAMSGKVVHGQKNGRTIGYPTANIPVKVLRSVVKGVYLTKVNTKSGDYWGMANVGTRPTLNGLDTRLEVHLFDFSDNLYGQRVQVTFVEKLRDEIKFPSFTELQQQIKADEAQALQLIAQKY